MIKKLLCRLGIHFKTHHDNRLYKWWDCHECGAQKHWFKDALKDSWITQQNAPIKSDPNISLSQYLGVLEGLHLEWVPSPSPQALELKFSSRDILAKTFMRGIYDEVRRNGGAANVLVDKDGNVTTLILFIYPCPKKS